MVQETHLRKMAEFIASKQRYPYQLLAASSSKASGTVILIKNTVRFVETACYKVPAGHFALTKGKLNDIVVMLAAIYVPNEGQVSFLESVFSKILTWGKGLWILAGELNYVSDLAVNRTHKRGLQASL